MDKATAKSFESVMMYYAMGQIELASAKMQILIRAARSERTIDELMRLKKELGL